MASYPFSDTELETYFKDPDSRRRTPPTDANSAALRVVRYATFATVGLALFSLAALLLLSRSTPSFEQLENPEMSLATVAYTADGELLTRFAFEDRTPVAYDSMSPYIVDALVATEDFRFPDHWGVDVFRTVVSVTKTILGDQQGGSTITQQLARNLYRDQVGSEVSIPRKIREWITAVQLERGYTKREIVEMYLNTVPFGYSTFGVETAAQTYFGIPASRLNLEQSALLIGMLQATSAFNPVRNPERALRRRNVVLNQMVRYGRLDKAAADSVKQLPIVLNFRRITHTQNLAPFFAEQVRLFVDRWAAENGYNTYADGLVVYTTLDSRLQAIAREASDRQMGPLQAVVDVEWSNSGTGFFNYETGPYVERANMPGFVPFDRFWKRETAFVDSEIRSTDRYRALIRSGLDRRAAVAQLRADTAFMDSLKTEVTRLEVGLVAIDPLTRHIKAWVGGRDYSIGKLDHVGGTRRQPGSTFKPFLYTAAIDNGYSPYYRLLDDTVTIYLPGMPAPWRPSNSGTGFSHQMMTLREGLRTSTNTIAARLVGEVGAEQVKTYAHRMGIQSPLEPVPSIALGTSDVSLLEMTNAYATLASGGFTGPPVFVTRIENRAGEVLAEFASEQEEVLSERTAYTMIDMLRGVMMSGGTGVRIRSQFGVQADVAGKTGTTQNSADGWFVLMHPQLVMGGWVGFNKPTLTFRTNYWGQGAHNALFVVGDFFSSVLKDPDIAFPDTRFVEPDGWSVPLPLPGVYEEVDDAKLGADRKGRIGW